MRIQTARQLGILVIGGEGQLARALVEAAVALPALDIVAMGRSQLDATDAASLARALDGVRPAVVINAAAYTAVDAAETDREAAARLNAGVPETLAEVATRNGAVLVHISTDYVFDGTKPTPYVETDATGPVSVYGLTKLAGEQVVRATAPRHLIVRTAWVHSAVGKNFVRTMLQLARSRDEIRVVADQTGSPTYAPHLAQALLAMATAAAAAGVDDPLFGTYHAAGTSETSWAGLAEHVFAVSSRLGGPTARVAAIGTADYPTPARRPANSRLDCAKLQQSFGLRLPEWQAGVEDCVARLITGAG